MEALKIDFTGILAFLVLIETLYTMLKTKSNIENLDSEVVHHIGTHILLKIGFIFAIINFNMSGDATAISIWGIYVFWHIHTENKRLVSGNHYL